MDRSELAEFLDLLRHELPEQGYRYIHSHGKALEQAASIIRSTAWRPMGEAPRDGTMFLALRQYEYFDEDERSTKVHQDCCIAQDMIGSWCSIPAYAAPRGQEFLAWQPLPPPPTGEVGT